MMWLYGVEVRLIESWKLCLKEIVNCLLSGCFHCELWLPRYDYFIMDERFEEEINRFPQIVK